MFRYTRFLLLLLLLSLAACEPTRESTPDTSDDPPILPNLLVQVTGQVEVQREGSTRFVPIALGATVQPGDTLRLVSGEASIFCGDEELWDTSPHPLPIGEEFGVPCLAGAPHRLTPEFSNLRSSNLYVLSPRNDFVMDERPTLRWHPVNNVETYILTLKGNDGKERLPVTAAGNELSYPAKWESLQAEAIYRLEIEVEINGEKKRSKQEGEFSLLSPKKKGKVAAQIKHLSQRPLNNLSLRLLLAELHLNNELYSEAYELLLKANGNQIVAVQRLLGETYFHMGLLNEATTTYSEALALAQNASLPEEQAIAYLGLGCAQTSADKARTHRQEALRLYQEMGSPADEVDAVLAEFDQKCIK